MAFTHLHVHTEYSLLDGSNKISEYVQQVKALGMNCAAITDHGVMYGVIAFYKAAKAAGIKPIIGCEIYVTPGSRFDREVSHGENRYYHLVLLAENNTGYANLMKIVSRGFTEGYYYKPRVDMEVLNKYHEGIIALSACLAGEIPRFLERNMYDEALAAAKKYEACFGKGNFFLELQDHGIPAQQTVNQGLLRISKETGIGLVATNDVHYTYADDVEPHDILLCIQTGKKLADENRMRYEGGQYFLKSEEQMRALFPYAQEACDNTQKIADRCNVEIEFGNTKLPRFDVPAGYTSWEYLNKLCEDGLLERYPDASDDIKERLRYELSVIKEMGYVDYFLIVWDFIRFARENGIMVGPGRGSAAGSIVSYCLGITKLDPLRYNLLFERFLNPERVSMPDIDIDFCYERRHEVIEYVVRKYGKECVVQIVTFGTMKARAVIRDVGRVMDLPYKKCDQIAKMIPGDLGITIDKALSMNPELRSLCETDPEVTRLIDMSKRLEGLPRHASMHAAGVVISSKPVEEYVPLSLGTDGAVTTQYTMTELEELGLLKMDFLGLRTLTVIRDAVDNIEKNTGISIDMDKIDYDDKDVLSSLSTGKTDGVFQLESGGMKSFMKELKPASLEDVIAGIALYRPGPMDFIPAYIKGKNNPESIKYDCPQMEPILRPTYGCIVYQEQVMQIVRDLAGYTLGRSDLVRRAMSKKKAKVMAEERKNFVYGNEAEGVPGCISRGISEDVANHIFDEMTDFANYAFNKSHAAAYAVVSYQTAWLKYYYPVEFMAALMTSVMDQTGKVAEYIQVVRQMDIEVLPPDVNEADGKFTARDGKIRYGIYAIKSIGSPVIEAIKRERDENGVFKSFEDFVERTSGDINKRAVENMIKAGCFDSFGNTRHALMIVHPLLIDSLQSKKKKQTPGQMSLFDIMDEEDKAEHAIRMPDVPEFSKEELLAMEKEVLGVYLSAHPLDEYRERWLRNITNKTTDLVLDEEGNAIVKDQQEITLGGLVVDKKVKYTKNNQAMCIFSLEDLFGSVEVLVFPRDFEKYKFLIEEDAKIFVSGRASFSEEQDGKLLCSKITAFDDVPKNVWIQFPDEKTYNAAEADLYEVFGMYPGRDSIIIYLSGEKKMKRIGERRVRGSEELSAALEKIAGEGNVKITDKK